MKFEPHQTDLSSNLLGNSGLLKGSIVLVIKSGRMRWTKHVAHLVKSAHRVLVAGTWRKKTTCKS